MARTAIYLPAKSSLLTGTLSLLGAGIKAIPVRGSYIPDFDDDEFLSDIPAGARAALPVALTGKTTVALDDATLAFRANSVTFSSVPAGVPITGLVIFDDTGTEGTSRLIGFFDYFTLLPITPTGVDITFNWPVHGIFILAEGVLGGPQGVPGPQGDSGIPTTTTIGLSVVYNEVTSAGEKRKKPAPTGHFDPHDYGVIDTTGVVACDAVIQATLLAINDQDSLSYVSATILFRGENSVYFFADNLILDQQVILKGQGGGSIATLGNTVFKFAPGKGIWIRHSGLDVSRGSGSQIDNIDVRCQRVPSVLDYAHATAYTVGQIVQFLHDRSTIYECVVAGTTETALNAAAAAGAAAVPTYSPATMVRAASTSYTAGDKVVPPVSRQNGHQYICLTSGTSSADLEGPEHSLFGGWDWVSKNKSRAVVWPLDGTVVWQEDEIYQPHFQHRTCRPFASAGDAKVVWTASTRYEHNAVIRVVGDGAEFTKWLWNGQGTGGVTGSSAPSLAGAVGTTVVDGGITWEIIDPALQGLLLVDGTAKFFVRQHPALYITTTGTIISKCSFSSASGSGMEYFGNANPPFSNCNHSRAEYNQFYDLEGGAISVRGADANGSIMVGNAMASGPWKLLWDDGVECNHSFRDKSAAGGTWIGNSNSEGAFGYAYDMGPGGAIIGGYSEGGPSKVPAVYIAGPQGAAGPIFTRGSNPIAPFVGRGIFGREEHTSGDWSVACYLAGRNGPADNVQRSAWAIQAESLAASGEANATGPAFVPAGWDDGWWGLCFGPETYGGVFSTFAFSGDLAGPWRDITSAGQFSITRNRLGFGKPTTGEGPPHVIAFDLAGEPSAGIWEQGDIHVDPTLIDAGGYSARVCTVAGDYAGTDPIWELAQFVHADCRARKITFVTDGTTTANQVIDAGSAMDFPADSMMEIEVRVAFKVDAEANAGSALLAGTFYRNGSADPVRVGTDDTPAPKLTAGIAGTTLDLFINTTSDKIEVRMTPGAAKVIKGNIIRIQTRRVG